MTALDFLECVTENETPKVIVRRDKEERRGESEWN